MKVHVGVLLYLRLKPSKLTEQVEEVVKEDVCELHA